MKTTILLSALAILLVGGIAHADCPDDVLDPGEQCDGSDWGGVTTCRDIGLMGSIACDSTTCEFTGCFEGCGDGVIRGLEQCDDGFTNSDVHADRCRTNCLLPHCGDGVTDSGEECDDGPSNHDTLPDACRTNCREASCGDEIIDVASRWNLDWQVGYELGHVSKKMVKGPLLELQSVDGRKPENTVLVVRPGYPRRLLVRLTLEHHPV